MQLYKIWIYWLWYTKIPKNVGFIVYSWLYWQCGWYTCERAKVGEITLFLLRKLLDYKQKKFLAEVNIYPLIGSHQALPAIKFKHRGFCQRPVIRPDYQSRRCWFCQALVLSNCFCQVGISARSRPRRPNSSQAGTESKALSCPWTSLPEAQHKKPSRIKRKHLPPAMCSRLFSHHF